MLILASKSPRRIELLKKIYPFEFKIIPSNFDERSIKEDDIYNYSLILAKNKGLSVSKENKDDYIISVDTTVIYLGKIYNKPIDYNDALKMLLTLNNVEHEVISSYCIIKNNQILKSNIVSAKLMISFKDEIAIKEYIDTKSPFDKAGGYGIQDEKYVSHKIINGNYDTIKGFPSKEIKQDLIDLKLINK